MTADLKNNVFIQTPSYIFWKDRSHVLRGCNENYACLAQVNHPDDVIGKTDYDFSWHEHAEIYRESDIQVLDGVDMTNIIEPQVLGGKRLVNIVISKKPLLDERNEVIGIIGSYMILRDLKYHGKPTIKEKDISLTEKQMECLMLLIKGMSVKQIAHETDSSSRTIEHRLEGLKIKFGSLNKYQLISKALTFDFIKTRLIA